MVVCCFVCVLCDFICQHDRDRIFTFRNVQTKVATLQEKNPPQPPKNLTSARLPVKASQLSKLNPMSYIFTFFTTMYLPLCITTIGLGLQQLYQVNHHKTCTFSNSIDNSIVTLSRAPVCTAAMFDEAAPTDLTRTLTRDRLPRLTYGLYHIKWPRGCLSLIHQWYTVCNGGPRTGCNRNNCLICVVATPIWYEEERSLEYLRDN